MLEKKIRINSSDSRKTKSSVGSFLAHCFAVDESCPAAGFPQFLQANFEFVDEIFPRLGGFSLAVIWVRRRAGTQNLSRDVTARPGTRQLFRQINDCRSKFQQTFFQIELSTIRIAFVKLPNARIPIIGCWMLNVEC